MKHPKHAVTQADGQSLARITQDDTLLGYGAHRGLCAIMHPPPPPRISMIVVMVPLAKVATLREASPEPSHVTQSCNHMQARLSTSPAQSQVVQLIAPLQQTAEQGIESVINGEGVAAAQRAMVS